MKKLLTEAVAGNATARAIVFQPCEKAAYIYPDSDSAWVMAYFGKDVFFEADGARNLDARTDFFYAYTVVTPAMAVTTAGKGSDYSTAFLDSRKKPLDGAKTYKLHLPPNVPANNFWAVTMYGHPDPLAAADQQSLPEPGQPEQGAQEERRRLVRHLFRPEAPPRARRATGSKPFPERAGSRFFECMARSSPGSTRPGARVRSSWSNSY